MPRQGLQSHAGLGALYAAAARRGPGPRARGARRKRPRGAAGPVWDRPLILT